MDGFYIPIIHNLLKSFLIIKYGAGVIYGRPPYVLLDKIIKIIKTGDYMRKAYTNFIIIVFSLFVLLSVIFSDASQAATNFEGKIVDMQGKPVEGVKVIAQQVEPLKGYDRVESVTKSDGIFVLTGLYPQDRYTICIEGGQCNDVDTSITTGPKGETKLLKGTIVLQYSPFNISKDGVIVDPRTGLEWAPTGGLGSSDRKQGFISVKLPWVHVHAAACF